MAKQNQDETCEPKGAQTSRHILLRTTRFILRVPKRKPVQCNDHKLPVAPAVIGCDSSITCYPMDGYVHGICVPNTDYGREVLVLHVN